MRCLVPPAVSTPSSSVLTPNSSLMRHPDRGAGFYHSKRERFGRASLVETGRRARFPLAEKQHLAQALLMQVVCTSTRPGTAASCQSATSESLC